MTDNIISYKRKVTCKISGGDLPKDFEVKIPVTLDFAGFVVDGDAKATISKLLDVLAMSSSPRVQLQNGYMRKQSTEVLKRFESDGYICNVNDLVTGKVREPAQNVIVKAAKKMTAEERAALIKQLEAMND